MFTYSTYDVKPVLSDVFHINAELNTSVLCYLLVKNQTFNNAFTTV